MSREWGIYPENCKPRQWWGARAIIEKGQMILLPDRQNYERDESVSDADRDDMFDWMRTKMDPAIQNQCRARKFREWGDLFVLNSESGRFHCEATPKNSGGCYLYIGCWEVTKET